MNRSCRILLMLSCLILLTAGAASADTLVSYNLTGPVSVSFELPVNPTPVNFDLGVGFQVTPINLTINGVASSDFLVFYNAAFGGAFGAFSCGSCVDANLAGPQFYSGSEATPTMLALNSAGLTDFDTGEPAGTISGGPVSTPEPSIGALASLGMLLSGLAVAAFRRKVAIVSI